MIADYGKERLVIRFDSLFTELVSRRDDAIRTGGSVDSISTDLYRSTPAFDLLLTIHEGSVEVRNEYYPADPGTKEPAEVIHYWGQGAVFVKLKR